MVPDPSTTCLGLEYFCFEDDGLWNMSDNDLLDIAKQEICRLGFADIDEIVDGTVVRMPKAYPVYDREYQHSLDVVRNYLSRFDNLQLIGRN